jgi:hypothetical protein
VNLSSEVAAPGWTHEIEMLWLDGDHTYEGVSRDLRCWEPHLTKDAVLVLDDTRHPEAGPARLVRELVEADSWRVEDVVGKMTILRRPE